MGSNVAEAYLNKAFAQGYGTSRHRTVLTFGHVQRGPIVEACVLAGEKVGKSIDELDILNVGVGSGNHREDLCWSYLAFSGNGVLSGRMVDFDISSEMLRIANLRLKFWDTKVSDEFTVLKVEAYYDSIKELIFAHLYKEGYNCTNHLCLIAYLKEKMKDLDFLRGYHTP